MLVKHLLVFTFLHIIQYVRGPIDNCKLTNKQLLCAIATNVGFTYVRLFRYRHNYEASQVYVCSYQ
jgi:hypothetical protein